MQKTTLMIVAVVMGQSVLAAEQNSNGLTLKSAIKNSLGMQLVYVPPG